MTYKKYIKPTDIIVYRRCKEWKHWKAQLDWVKPWSIASSLHKLLRLWYLDWDYNVIKDINIKDISIKLWREYVNISYILQELEKYWISLPPELSEDK